MKSEERERFARHLEANTAQDPREPIGDSFSTPTSSCDITERDFNQVHKKKLHCSLFHNDRSKYLCVNFRELSELARLVADLMNNVNVYHPWHSKYTTC